MYNLPARTAQQLISEHAGRITIMSANNNTGFNNTKKYINTGANGKKPTSPIIWVLVGIIALLLVVLVFILVKDSGTKAESSGTSTTYSAPKAAAAPAAVTAAPTPHTHTWSPATCTRPAKCTICGAEQGSALGHSWVAATYEQPRHCTVCGLQDGTTVARPSAKDLDSIGSNIVYPNEYLSEYKTRTVVAKHKICVYIYYSAKATEDNRLPYDLAHMTKVTVIAEKNGLSCVIYKDANGNNRSGWVTSTHLVE